MLIACTPVQRSTVVINTISIPVEVATTSAQQEKGLMGRTTLDGGMLFIFPEESTRTFWMKDTLIPLDIIFIGKNFAITKIHHAIPCTTDYCDIYPGQAQYVLEVNQNFTTEHNITEGTHVILKQ